MIAVKILLTVALGLFLYGLRYRRPLLFGLLEVAVALALIFLTFYPVQSVLLTDNPPLWGPAFSEFVGALAGIYVMVDGLDNIDKELPANSWWKRIFAGETTLPRR